MNDKIDNRLNFLNQNHLIRKVFFSDLTTDKIWDLGKKYQMNANQTSAMAKDIGLVMLREITMQELQKKYPQAYPAIEKNILSEIKHLLARKLAVQETMEKYEKELKEPELPAPKDFYKELKSHNIHIEKD